jgi:hypothetical protein
MITGIVTIGAGIAVMLGSGVALSTALAWMNNFDVDLKGKKSPNRGREGNRSRAEQGRSRIGGGGPRPGAGMDMFE